MEIELFEDADIVCTSNVDDDEFEDQWFRPEEEDEYGLLNMRQSRLSALPQLWCKARGRVTGVGAA